MDYPKTWLKRRVRLAIMFCLIGAFFVISPTILMYTAGYRFDFTTHRLKQTGVISIDILPKDVTVYLNDILINLKQPIRLDNRAPGTYTIKFTKPGYQDWQKEITVDSQKTTYLKNITLFKQSLPILINEQNYDDLYFSNQADYALAVNNPTTKKDKNYQITLLNLKTATAIITTSTLSNSKPVIEWSPFNNYYLILNTNSGGQTLTIINADYPAETEIFNFTEPINSWQWSAINSASLYVYDGQEIKIINNNNYRNIYSNTSTLWFIDSQENLWTIDHNLLYKNLQSLSALDDNLVINKIIDADSGRIILQTNNGYLAKQLNNKNEQLLPTQNIYFNNGTREWLTYSPWELWSIYQNGTASLLTRTSEQMNEIIPLDNYGLILIHSGQKLLGFNPGYYVSHELLNNVEIKKIGANTNSRTIFFWGKFTQKSGIFELDY